MNKEILQRIKEKLRTVPTTPGVYRMLDIDGNIIYVGKAVNLKRRVSSYFLATKKQEKVAQMVEKVYDFEYTLTNSELEALNLESNLIHKIQPFYNILLKDGKAFPYIKIDMRKDFPVIEVTRRISKDGAMYFGPYFNKIDIRSLTDIIEHTFKLRTCSNNITLLKRLPRPCLNYAMGLCLAPCVNKDIHAEYMEEIKKVVNFLKGNLTQARDILQQKMLNASSLQMYEKALEYKKQLTLIENLKRLNITELTQDIDLDIFGYATNGEHSCMSLLVVRGGKMVGSSNYSIVDGSIEDDETKTNFITQYYISQKKIADTIVCDIEDIEALSTWLNDTAGKKINVIHPKTSIKKRLLDMANDNAKEYLTKTIQQSSIYSLKTQGAMETLQTKLGLSRLPRRIEGYDISNLQGTNTVASMVVFENATPNKKHYRKFKIDIDQQNDFFSMNNVISRRFTEYRKGEDVSFAKMPDLVLIDGGLGQLHKAYEALKSNGINVDIVSLAKRDELIYTIHSSKPVQLAKSDYALKLLQNVRDESHRFAITFQRSLRKNTMGSELEKVSGLSNIAINNLVAHFKSTKAIKTASIDELTAVSGIGNITARKIFDYFHKG